MPTGVRILLSAFINLGGILTTKVTVLIEGYARKNGKYYEATCSTILLEDSGKRILVDPGCNEGILIQALRKRGISLKSIDLIFVTHTHLDHILNVRLFPHVDVADGTTIYRGGKEVAYRGILPGTTIHIIPTPGHTADHATPLVRTEQGIIAIAGDLWWWEGEQKTDQKSLMSLADPLATDRAILLKSRKLILSKADYIIPGHGSIFRV